MTLLPDMRYIRPADLSGVLVAWAEHPDGRLVAGGTDLLVNLRRGLGEPSTLIDISGVSDLAGITGTPDGGLRIGAATTLAALIDDPRLRRGWPAAVSAAEGIAGPTHRLRATVGGNLCLDTRCVHFNESDWWRKGQGYCLKYRGDTCHIVAKSDRCYAAYSGDLAPALLVADAEVEVASAQGVRRLPLDALFREDGRAPLALAPGELLTAVLLPPANDLRSAYEKVRARAAIDFPLAGVAVALRLEDDTVHGLRIAVTGTNSCPVLLDGLEEAQGRPLGATTLEIVRAALRRAIAPLKTTTTGPRYRRDVAAGVAERLLRRLTGDA